MGIIVETNLVCGNLCQLHSSFIPHVRASDLISLQGQVGLKVFLESHTDVSGSLATGKHLIFSQGETRVLFYIQDS